VWENIIGGQRAGGDGGTGNLRNMRKEKGGHLRTLKGGLEPVGPGEKRPRDPFIRQAVEEKNKPGNGWSPAKNAKGCGGWNHHFKPHRGKSFPLSELKFRSRGMRESPRENKGGLRGGGNSTWSEQMGLKRPSGGKNEGRGTRSLERRGLGWGIPIN